jgi:hypothetical protein
MRPAERPELAPAHGEFGVLFSPVLTIPRFIVYPPWT